jgi:SAM-dependent methyltransferase
VTLRRRAGVVRRRAVTAAHAARETRRTRRGLRELVADERASLVAFGSAAFESLEPGALDEAGRRVQRARRALEFGLHAPWTTRFVIDGQVLGGAYDAAGDGRLQQFRTAFPDARRVLELGSLEGGHTYALAALPGIDRVLALEGRPANVERAQLVGRLSGAASSSIELRVADLEQTDLTALGTFDAVFCVGLLYHLPRPWELLERIAQVSNRLFLWTMHAVKPVPEEARAGYEGRSYAEFGLADPLSGLSPISFWPTLDALVAMLADAGFDEVEIIEKAWLPERGAAVTLSAASRGACARA